MATIPGFSYCLAFCQMFVQDYMLTQQMLSLEGPSPATKGEMVSFRNRKLSAGRRPTKKIREDPRKPTLCLPRAALRILVAPLVQRQYEARSS